MAVHSGRFAAVDGALALRQWSVGEKSEVKALSHAGIVGSVIRVPGFKDWDGNWSEWGGKPVVKPGDSINFVGFMGFGLAGDDTDPLPATGTALEGTARVHQVVVNFNSTSGGDPVNHQVNFEGDGASSMNAAAAVPAAPGSVVVPAGVCDMVIKGKIGLAAEFTWDAWTTAVLTLSRPNVPYSNSSNACQMRRAAGPNLDVTLNLSDQQMVRQAVIGDLVEVKLYVNATEFWHLKWMRVLNISGVTVNRETSEIVGQTYEMGFSGYDATATKGQIHAPGAVVLW